MFAARLRIPDLLNLNQFPTATKIRPRLSLAFHLVSASPPFHPFPLSLSHIVSSSTTESARLIVIAAPSSRSGSGPFLHLSVLADPGQAGISTNYGTTCFWFPPHELCKCLSGCQVPRGQSQLSHEFWLRDGPRKVRSSICRYPDSQSSLECFSTMTWMQRYKRGSRDGFQILFFAADRCLLLKSNKYIPLDFSSLFLNNTIPSTCKSGSFESFHLIPFIQIPDSASQSSTWSTLPPFSACS